MKVVYTRHRDVLETHLKDVAHLSSLKIERTIRGTYILKRPGRFHIWTTVAKIDVNKQTVFTNETEWKYYEVLIKRLANIVGQYAKPILVIEVRP